MINIELFNLAVAEVLGQCYESFPDRIRINGFKVGESLLEFYGDDVETQHPDFGEKIFAVGPATLDWLAQAGYIWVGNKDQADYLGVTLSPKGLELLNLVPDSLNSSDSIGSTLVQGAKVLGKESILAGIKLALSEGMKLAVKTGI